MLPLEMRDAKGSLILNIYDELLRPRQVWARDNANHTPTLRQQMIYGESSTLTNPQTVNLKGQLHLHFDEAGKVEIPEYDFKGNPLSKTRQVIKDSKLLNIFTNGASNNWAIDPFKVDWDGVWSNGSVNTTIQSDYLDSKAFSTDIEYDALSRIIKTTIPQDVSGNRKVLAPTYNRAGALEQILLDGNTYVERISYNAKGQRLLVAYGNDLMQRYTYDNQIPIAIGIRLARMKTEKYTASQSGSQITYAYNAGTAIQDTNYAYDLNGNIINTNEDTTTAGAGGSGNLSRDFTYDPLYRLLSATGRESGSFSTADPAFVAPNNASLGATDTYTRNYEYDQLGNILRMQHIPGTGSTWNRYFNDFDTAPTAAYASKNLATKVKYAGTTYNYTYDPNGNLIQEGTNRHHEWDHADQLRAFFNQTGSSEPTVYAQYLYDAGGNRIKKIVRKSSGNEQVTVYIDGVLDYLYEIDGSSNVTEEFNDIHVMDDRKRIAVVAEYATNFSGDKTKPIRYNLEDHLGNGCWTLDGTGAKISQEEYFPFGESSFHDFAYKRYRFVGKERDEESGLYYYGMRYYAPWMLRFISVDPLFRDYPWYTPYQYAGNKPIIAIDLDGLEEANQVDEEQQQEENEEGSTVSESSEATNEIENLFPKENIVKAAELMANSSFGFLGSSRKPLYYWWEDIKPKKLQKEKVLWERDSEMGTQNNPGMSLVKGTPSEAMKEIGKNSKDWVFDCAMHCQIILLYTALNTYGGEEFNKVFENDKGGYTMRIGFFDSSGLNQDKNIIRTGDSYIDISEENKPKNIGNASVASELIENAPVGAIITMHTNDPTVNPAWRNENILKLGDGLFSAHPFGVKTWEEIISRLNEESGPDYPYYLFQIQHISFGTR